jgi:hypothetical protein
MAKLTASERDALPKSDFALPGGRYPIENASHARNALARVSQHGSAEEQDRVRAKVRAKFPGIGRKRGGKIDGAEPAERPDRRRRGGACSN